MRICISGSKMHITGGMDPVNVIATKITAAFE